LGRLRKENKIMKVIRLIVFEGSEEAITAQLERSLPDLTHRKESKPMSTGWGGKPVAESDRTVHISVITVEPEDLLVLGEQVDRLRQYCMQTLDWARVEEVIGNEPSNPLS
jgi:hypothetical protein